jgi:hypothetical protein
MATFSRCGQRCSDFPQRELSTIANALIELDLAQLRA